MPIFTATEKHCVDLVVRRTTQWGGWIFSASGLYQHQNRNTKNCDSSLRDCTKSVHTHRLAVCVCVDLNHFTSWLSLRPGQVVGGWVESSHVWAALSHQPVSQSCTWRVQPFHSRHFDLWQKRELSNNPETEAARNIIYTCVFSCCAKSKYLLWKGVCDVSETHFFFF